MAGSVRLAIDIGGTFTDLAAYRMDTGELMFTKVSTTPQSLSDAVVGCIKKIGLALAHVDLFIHGSTVGINTIVERKGPATALITTEGFKDVYEMGRRDRPRIYDLLFHRPVPLIPRDRVFEVRERLYASGEVLVPIVAAEVEAVLETVRNADVASVAVCLLHSYANPEHERLVGNLVEKVLPGVALSLSSDINREYREYERTSTVAINAYLQPVVGRYLGDLQRRLADLGFAGRTLVMQSSGGIMTLEAASRQPVRIIESGPAGGVAGALWVCRALQHDDAIAFDMGGTTAKACLVKSGRAAVTNDYHVGGRVEGHPAQVPFLDIIEIGAGGGSIAWIDQVGALKIGPESAGAEPGPACYSLGGERPTITDANLVTGKLDPDRFLGGEMPLDVDAARNAIDTIARPLGLSTMEAAIGVLRIANAMMAQAISKVTVERGHDPRDFAMIAYGGAGPVHATAVARDLGIRKVIIPPAPGQFSALGMLTTDIRYDYAQTFVVAVSAVDAASLERRYADMEDLLRKQLKEDVGTDDVTFARGADMRYLGQFHTITVPVPAHLDKPAAIGELIENFHRSHEERYGHSASSEPTELIGLRVTATVPLAKPSLAEIATGDSNPPDDALLGRRMVHWENGLRMECPIFSRERLRAGNRIVGPTIIQESASVIPVGDGQAASIDRFGNIVISMEDA